MSEYPTHGRRDATAEARSAPQNGAAGAPQPRHMMPCACHCAACGDGVCVVLCAGLHALFDGKADVVDQILRQYYGACGWGTARFDAGIGCVQYGPGLGDVIAAGSSDGRIHLICAQTGEKILCPLSCDSHVFSIDWHDNRIVAGCHDGTIKVFDAQSGDRLSTVRGHSADVNSVAWSPDGTKLASGSDDRTVRIWEAATGKQLWQLRGHDREVMSVSWSPDGTRLASGSLDARVLIWDAASGEQLCSLNGHSEDNPECLCEHPSEENGFEYTANPECPVRGA